MSDDDNLSSCSREKDEAWEVLVEFEMAAIAGDVMRSAELLRRLAESGENWEAVLSSIDNEGQSFLHKLVASRPSSAAHMQGMAATALLLIEASAHLCTENMQGETALLVASKAAVDMLGQESEEEASIDSDVRLGLVSSLLSARADPDMGDIMDETPLMEAACAGDFDLCKLLLSFGADANKVSRSGLIATDFTDSYPEIEQLLKMGLRRSDMNGLEEGLLDKAAEDLEQPCGQYAGNAKTEWALDLLQATLEHQGTCTEKADAAVRALQVAVDADSGAVSYGVALQSRNGDGQLFLQLCQAPNARDATVDAVKWMIRAKADIDVTNALGQTPLALAVWTFCKTRAESGDLKTSNLQGGMSVVHALLQARADPNRGDGRGETPLMEAVCSGNAEMCTALLDAGAEALVSEGNTI